MIIIAITDGKYYASAYFGAGSGTIWFDNVACTSSNTKLVQCSSNPIGKEDCSHSEDAGVGCEGAYVTNVCDNIHFDIVLDCLINSSMQ